MFICGVVLRDAFVSKDFWNFNNQLGVIFSRWFSRLTRVLFNCNAWVRPSIIGYRIWCCGAQETSWLTIRTSVLICIYSAVLSCCVSIVCYWCELWLMYSDDVIYVNWYIWFWVKIIYYLLYFIPLRWLDSDVVFGSLFFYLFFLNPNGSYFCTTWVDCCRIVLTQGVRICGSFQNDIYLCHLILGWKYIWARIC